MNSAQSGLLSSHGEGTADGEDPSGRSGCPLEAGTEQLVPEADREGWCAEESRSADRVWEEEGRGMGDSCICVLSSQAGNVPVTLMWRAEDEHLEWGVFRCPFDAPGEVLL